ncbi:hypothetical protein Vi05172_g13657 [Venturia inaequalis]|nr:hypothetical protein Vi05172_g13657 [Venturia inaequalis]
MYATIGLETDQCFLDRLVIDLVGFDCEEAIPA